MILPRKVPRWLKLHGAAGRASWFILRSVPLMMRSSTTCHIFCDEMFFHHEKLAAAVNPMITLSKASKGVTP
jgi:hypothetical protein